MKKIITSVAIIAAVAAVVIGGTSAFFSDTETSTGNTFSAGSIDLKIDSDCHYNGMVCDEYTNDQGVTSYIWKDEDGQEGNEVETEYVHIGASCTCSWEVDDLTGQAFFNYQDIKPGDWGENTISFHLDSNPAWACLFVDRLIDADNTCTEPEQEEEDGLCEEDINLNGELDEAMKITAWVDYDCENDYDDGDEYIIVDQTLSQYLSGGIGAVPIAAPYEGMLRKPLQPGDYCVAIAWEIPTGAGNEVQTDQLGADLSFYVEQARHNDDFTCHRIIDDSVTHL